MAAVNARTAWPLAGTDFGSTALIVQSPSRTSAACDSLKWSSGPEKRKPAIRFGRGLGDQVSGVHHEHRVELEPHRWTRLDVADSREEKRGETLAVGEALSNAGGDLFEEPRARRVLEQAHQRLDRRVEANDLGVHPACAAETGVRPARNASSP